MAGDHSGAAARGLEVHAAFGLVHRRPGLRGLKSNFMSRHTHPQYTVQFGNSDGFCSFNGGGDLTLMLKTRFLNFR